MADLAALASVYRHYTETAAAMRVRMPGGRILKTDCYNEAMGRPAADGRMTLVDIDESMVKKARDSGYNGRTGDIRALPFGDGSFDAVMDFSTLDHIPPADVPKALSEYARVLCSGGALVLIVWLSFGRIESHGPDQMFFREKVVEDALVPFEVESKRDLYETRAYRGCLLREYAGRKRA